MLNDTQHQSRNISHISRDSCLQWKEDDRTYRVSHILISHGGRRGRGGALRSHTTSKTQCEDVFLMEITFRRWKGLWSSRQKKKKNWDNRTDKSIVEGKSEKRQSSFGCCSRSVATPAWLEPASNYLHRFVIYLVMVWRCTGVKTSHTFKISRCTINAKVIMGGEDVV